MSDTDFGNVRLSPIEIRNISLINDPALEGLHTGGAAFSENFISDREAPPVRNETDAETIGKVVTDTLDVSAAIRRIIAGPNGPVASKAVRVDEANPHFSTDGLAIYSKDGKTLVSLVVPCTEYEIARTCEIIADRAFDSKCMLERITLPDGLRSIGRLAFAKSGIRGIDLPDSLETIGEKAFFSCRDLVACRMGEAVSEIGDEAFAFSSIGSVSIPAGVICLGRDIFENTPALRASLDGSIELDGRNPVYSMDGQGGLYKNGAFAMMLSPAQSYSVREGCTQVMDNAFRRNRHLVSVNLPEGLTHIGDDAFRGCKNLAHISLPGTLRHIGSRAFMDTSISHLDISDSVSHIGEGALLVGGENPVRPHRPLRSLSLGKNNRHFFMESGILCERGAGDGGADKALVYVGPSRKVAIPKSVNRIAPYAFLGATDIDELHVHGKLHSICEGAFSVARSIPRITVDLISEEDGQASQTISLPVPNLSYRYQNYSSLFTTDRGRTVFSFFYYDAWVISTANVREFTDAAIERLRRPIWMTAESEGLYRGILDRRRIPICEYLAKNGDMDALVDLHLWGLMDVETVDEVIARTSQEADAQMRGCLLEAKRRFGKTGGLDLAI